MTLAELRALIDQRERIAVLQELALIVAYMRTEERTWPGCQGWADLLADEIERGEHRRSPFERQAQNVADAVRACQRVGW